MKSFWVDFALYEIQEVKNAYQAYEHLLEYDPYKVLELQENTIVCKKIFSILEFIVF